MRSDVSYQWFPHRTHRGWCDTRASTLLLAGFVAVSEAGCGASYQSLYEGEVRFEHCYRLDEEQGMPPGQRRACWHDWSMHYTYGQTRDRLEYALRRQRELTAQITDPYGVAGDATGLSTPPNESGPGRTTAPTAASATSNPATREQTKTLTQPAAREKSDAARSGYAPYAVDLQNPDHQPTAQPCLVRCLGISHACLKVCGSKTESRPVAPRGGSSARRGVGAKSSDCPNACDAALKTCCKDCFE